MSNRINLPLTTQKRDRRGLLKLLALSPVAIAAALIVAGFAFASSGVEEAHAAGPATITATATGPASPAPAQCPPPYINGDFTINQGGPTTPQCGDGADENTTWTFDFTGDLDWYYPFCPSVPNQVNQLGLTSARLSITMTVEGAPWSNDLVYVGFPFETLVPAISVTDSGWDSGGFSPALNATSASSKELVAGGPNPTSPVRYPSSGILGILNDSTYHPVGRIPMGYQDDALISSATLVLTCGVLPDPAVGGVAALTVSDSASPVPWAPLAAVAASTMAVLAAGFWYGRRRWLR